MSTIIAAVREHNTDDALNLILLLVGVLCIVGAAWRAWLRDFAPAVVLLIIGIVILYLSA